MLEKGTRVRVSDGTPEPPKHHTKKHSRWEFCNREGYVFRDETDKYGTISVGDSPNPVMVISYPSRYVTAIEGGVK